MRLLRAAATAALVAISACAQATPTAPTAETMWKEFRRACWDIKGSNFDAKAIKAGWQPFEPEDGSYFAKQREFARVEVAKVSNDIPKGSFSATDKLFTRRVGERSIYLWVAPGTVQKDGDTYEIVTCSVLDPAAVEAIPETSLSKLGGRPPERFGGELAIGYRWVPGLDNGQVNTVVMFVPLTAREQLARLGVEMQGLVLKQQTITKIAK